MKVLFSHIIFFMLFNNSLLAQNDSVEKKIKSVNSKVSEQTKISLLVKSGILSWSTGVTSAGNSLRLKSDIAESKTERDSLLKTGVLKWSEYHKKRDTVEIRRLLDNKVIQWSEKKRNIGVKIKNDN